MGANDLDDDHIVALARTEGRIVLTLRHHDTFRRCAGCDQIYWRGSHRDRLDHLVAQIRRAVDP